MPKHDAPAGLIPASGPPDEQVLAYLRRFLPDFYFVNAPMSRMRRHRAILQALSDAPSGVVIEWHHAPGASFSELVLCARDAQQPGLLADVVATLEALGIGVQTAWIHTLPAFLNTPEKVVLDTLLVSETVFRRPRALSTKTQKTLALALSRVLGGQESAANLLAQAPRARQKSARAPLRLEEITASRVGGFSLFKLRALDSGGVLSRITRALAAQNIHIAHAQINTFEREVDDVFFVLNAHGQPFSDEEAELIAQRLRENLAGTP